MPTPAERLMQAIIAYQTGNRTLFDVLERLDLLVNGLKDYIDVDVPAPAPAPSPSPAPSDPDELSVSPVVWFSSRDETTHTITSGALETIASKVGSVTATQSTSGSRPTISSVNGQASILFDGSNDFLRFTYTGAIRTLVQVWRIPSGAQQQWGGLVSARTADADKATGNSDLNWTFGLTGSGAGGPGAVGDHDSDTAAVYHNGSQLTLAAVTNFNNYLVGVSIGDGVFMLITEHVDDTPPTGDKHFVWGADALEAVGDRHIAGHALELILYNGILTADDKADLWDYVRYHYVDTSAPAPAPAPAPSPAPSTVEVWLDASDSDTITESGGVISAVASKAKSRTASQSTADYRPTLVANQYNSLPTIRFDGANDFLTLSGTFKAKTIFAVMRLRSTPATPFAGLIACRPEFATKTAVSDAKVVVHTNASNTTLTGDGSLSLTRLNGQPVSNTSLVNVGTSLCVFTFKGSSELAGLKNFCIGADTHDPIGNRHLPLDLCELLIYSSDMTNAEMATEESRLVSKWGVTASAPAPSPTPAPAPPPSPAPAPTPAPAGYVAPVGQSSSDYPYMTFREEFNWSSDLFGGPAGSAGSNPSPLAWDRDHWYQRNPRHGLDTVRVTGGELQIRVQQNSDGSWSPNQATVNTDGKFYQRYGYFEIRCKLGYGLGRWPSFWLYAHPDNGERPEIDFFEAYTTGGGANGGWDFGDGNFHHARIATNVHGPDRVGNSFRHHGEISNTWASVNFSTSYNVIGGHWDENEVRMYLNGSHYGTIQHNGWINGLMYILVADGLAGLEAGGAGGPPNVTDTPQGWEAAMCVDYIRCWGLPGGRTTVDGPYVGYGV